MHRQWTNLSSANVATTSPAAHRIATEWADSLARGGAAEFDADAEKHGMMPLREAASKLMAVENRGRISNCLMHAITPLQSLNPLFCKLPVI